MSKKVNLIRSETWIADNYEDIRQILEETTEECVEDDEKIINIEMKTNKSGLSRFWVYTVKVDEQGKED